MDYDQIELNDLSVDMQIVALDAGIDIARLFLKKLPGVNLQITYKPEPESATYKILNKKLGEKITARVYETLKGINITIPKSLPRRFMARYIVKNFDGKNIKAIAIDLGVSEKTVYNILNNRINIKNDKEEPADLFSGCNNKDHEI